MTHVPAMLPAIAHGLLQEVVAEYRKSAERDPRRSGDQQSASHLGYRLPVK